MKWSFCRALALVTATLGSAGGPAETKAVARTAQVPSVLTLRTVNIGPYQVQPRVPSAPRTFLIAGVTPQYIRHHTQAPENFRGNTDTLMLVQLDAKTNVIRTLSLPRDTRAFLPGVGWSKLNAALPRLGPDGMVSAVERLTGVNVHAYVLINLAGVRRLTDALGGVSVYVSQPMHYDDFAGKLHIHLNPGVHRLNGTQAEGYVRFRRDALGDIGRAQRQQAFVRGLVQRALSPAGLSNLAGITSVLTRDVRTNLTASDVGALLGLLSRRPHVEARLLPGRFSTVSGVSYWSKDDVAARRALVSFGSQLAGAGEERDVRLLRVSIVSLGASNAVISRVQARLWKAGYRKVTVRRQGVPNGRQSAVLSNGSLRAAQTVQHTLGFGEARISGEGSIDADVTVWVGRDARIP